MSRLDAVSPAAPKTYAKGVDYHLVRVKRGTEAVYCLSLMFQPSGVVIARHVPKVMAAWENGELNLIDRSGHPFCDGWAIIPGPKPKKGVVLCP